VVAGTAGLGGAAAGTGGSPGAPSTNPCSRPDSPNPENPCSGLGIYDECLPHGQSFDRRFASDPCCEGLSLVPFDLLQDPTSTGHPLPGLATSTDAMSSKGSKPCKPVYCARRSLERRKPCSSGGNLDGALRVSNPAQQGLATGCKRVLRGVVVRRPAKRRQRALRPRD
jgi:hypothetical protein